MQIVYRDEVLFEKRSYIDGKRDGIGIKYDPRPEGRCLKPYKNGKLSLRMEYNRYGNLEQKSSTKTEKIVANEMIDSVNLSKKRPISSRHLNYEKQERLIEVV